MFFLLHHISQSSDYSVRIVRSKLIKVGVINISIPSHFVSRIKPYQVHCCCTIFSHTMPVLLRAVFEVNVLNRTCKSHSVYEASHWFLPLFGQARRGGDLYFRHNIFYFQGIGTCSASCFRCCSRRFPFVSIAREYSLLFFTGIGRFIPSFRTANPTAPNWTSLFSWEKARSASEYGFIGTRQTFSILKATNSSGAGWTMFSVLV